MVRPAISLPAPPALAALTQTLTPPGLKAAVYEPKWDGYRALDGAGRRWSRRGSDLTRLFPDLAPVPAARLPDGGKLLPLNRGPSPAWMLPRSRRQL